MIMWMVVLFRVEREKFKCRKCLSRTHAKVVARFVFTRYAIITFHMDAAKVVAWFVFT